MKVVHLCLGSFYPDNYSYQENMLPKFHKELGYEVEVIASTQSFDEHGKTCYLDKIGSYYNEYDIKVTRLPYKNDNRIWKKLKRYIGTYEAIEKAKPDILFIHGGQFLDMDEVVKYVVKHGNVKVFVDNHADFSNSATNWFSKNVLHKVIWRYCLHMIEPYSEKIYGVLPARVDFLKEIYKLPSEKCELLVMGADDELVEKARASGAHKRIRMKYNIADNDFLIVTGGKIDKWKTQTIFLMQAVKNIGDENIKLIVFGSVVPELSEKLNSFVDGKSIQYIGWIDSRETYDLIEACDLAIYPGRHSVLWEQTAGQGKPMIVKDWLGTHHVDIEGNVLFIKEDSADEIEKMIRMVYDNKYIRDGLEKHAQRAKLVFSYRDIARRAIE